MAHERLIEDLWVNTRCVMLEPLDEHRKPILSKDGTGYKRASGFITDGIWDNVFGSYKSESRVIHLYTCWHVVVGHDPRDVSTPRDYTQPNFLKVTGVGVESPNSVIGRESFVVSLYDEDGRPSWEQERCENPHSNFNSIEVRLPKNLDAVRLTIEINPTLLHRWAIDPEHSDDRFFELGEDVFVCGYPYGFSALGDNTLMPVFLKRSIASTFSNYLGVSLLDSGCIPIMSGGPVFSRTGENWRLVGMYSGSVYTNPHLKNEAEKKATALGAVMSFATIKQSIGTVWKTM